MKILLTGASGFLGTIFKEEWLKNDHEVIAVGRSHSNDIICDLSEISATFPECEVVVHAASKAHTIPKNEIEEKMYFDTNVKGTMHLLKGLEQNKTLPKTLIYISSVSVYGMESGLEIDESYQLKAQDAYGKSKLEAEKVVQEWCSDKDLNWYIFRIPLIAGPNPTGNLGDMIHAIRNGYYFSVGNGTAVKSIVSARVLAKFIEMVTGKSGVYNLVHMPHPTLRQIEDILANLNNSKIRSIPEWMAKAIAKLGDIISFIPLNSRRLNKITTTLTFSDAKARKAIGWPTLTPELKQIFE